MNHKELLKMAVHVAESKKFNPRDLEYRWYAPWNIILTHWFGEELLICPQHLITYTSEDRDGNFICEGSTPDFTVIRYTKFGNNMSEFIPLIVENKRAAPIKELEKEMLNASEQLHNYISILFLGDGYDETSGIIAVGRYWKWYKYSRIKNNNTHKPSNSWGNSSYETGKKSRNFRAIWESPIHDLLDDRYEEHLEELSSYVN